MQPLQSNGYNVYFENALTQLGAYLAEYKYSRIFILTDRETTEHCLPVLLEAIPSLTDYDHIEVDPGEENKNIDFCIGIWRMLLDFGADRHSLLINLGGGVVTDMGGFAASTFKRGIDFVQVPTTLLSQVDASVGGKTGIDLFGVKNIIGTFTQPKAVFIHARFLQTLPDRQVVSGFAEMLKHGLIYDLAYFDQLKTIEHAQIGEAAIYRSVQIKSEVVTADPEEKSLRKILNFGHTIGHAIESFSLAHDSRPLLHGEAIAIGMVAEAYLSHLVCGLPLSNVEEIDRTFSRFFPDYTLNELNYPQILEYMINDKKNTSGKIGFALLDQIGHCLYDLYADEALIRQALNYYRNSRRQLSEES
ncbi:3-dehydroquinate synthase [bacterium A37T11]|nr:3-dehydroquinate synthase [bacterium A37T11]